MNIEDLIGVKKRTIKRAPTPPGTLSEPSARSFCEWGEHQDGTIWVSISNGKRHGQFDFLGDKWAAEFIVKCCNAVIDREGI